MMRARVCVCIYMLYRKHAVGRRVGIPNPPACTRCMHPRHDWPKSNASNIRVEIFVGKFAWRPFWRGPGGEKKTKNDAGDRFAGEQN